MEVKGITLHNTGNRLSAEELAKYLKNNNLIYLCHYLVDEKEVIEMQPIELPSFHTGKGEDFGNMHTISIEICRSMSDLDTYLRAQARAMKLVRSLMKEYDLKKTDIYFHCDFDRTVACPHRILKRYKTKKDFLRVELENTRWRI